MADTQMGGEKGHQTQKISGVVCALVLSMLTVGSAVATTDSAEWQFKVSLDGNEIGYHNFHLYADGDRQILETEAKFDVKFLFITAFRYRHQNTETWQNGFLTSIDATTDSNGKQFRVSGQQGSDGFAVKSTSGNARLDNPVRTFAYWNPEILEAERLLNSQTGEYEEVSVQFEGADEVRIGNNVVNALRYRLSVKAGNIRLWYSSDDMRWLALEAPAKGGRTIRYDPVSVPGAAPGQQQLAGSL